MNAIIDAGVLENRNTPTPDNKALLEIRNLRIEYRGRYESVVAVPDVSLSIAPGESYGLVGESGCGKTTTAMAVMGYLGSTGRVTGGSIRFEGEELVGASAEKLRAIRGRRVAMVYQEPMSALNPVKTIGAQLAEVPRRHLGSSRAEARELCATMLENVRLPDPLAMLKRFPHQLSGGQQQRIVIAMALLARPALLLLDEPTTGLDVTVEAAILDLIADLRKQYGTSLLYISHNLGLIASACDRVGIMYSGEMIEEADTQTLFRQPRHPYTQGLLGCIPGIGSAKGSRALSPIPGHLPSPAERPQGCSFGPRCAHFQKDKCGGEAITLAPAASEDHLVRCIRWRDLTGESVALGGEVAVAAEHETALSITDVSKQYLLGGRRTVQANESVSFEVGKGEIVGLVGESGCGKSSLARMLVGLEEATSGSIQYAGIELAQIPAKKRTRDMLKSIQMVFQNPDSTLNPSHSVASPIRRALHKFGGYKDKAAIEQRLQELLKLVRLPTELAQRRPSQLSGGQKQRIAIARAFATNPSLIVADEPVSALDVSVQAAIVTLLLAIQKEQQSTMLFISHDLALVRHIADRIVVMYLGRVMEKGLAEEIFAPPYHPYTEALLSAVHSPDASVKQQDRIRLTGETPSPINIPAGCRFASRCHRKIGEICDTVAPPVRRASPTHEIACHISLEELRTMRPVFQQSAPMGSLA